MERSRFEEGLTIAAYLERLAARRVTWLSGYDTVPEVLPLRLAARSGVRAVVLAEDWSFECAVALPPILRFLAGVPNLETRLFPRDENLDVAMEVDRDDPLAIPRVAFWSAEGERLARWGPRAAAAERVLSENQAQRPKSERIWRLREWYAADRGRAGVGEVRAILASMPAAEVDPPRPLQ
jgi:hypothetical protein